MRCGEDDADNVGAWFCEFRGNDSPGSRVVHVRRVHVRFEPFVKPDQIEQPDVRRVHGAGAQQPQETNLLEDMVGGYGGQCPSPGVGGRRWQFHRPAPRAAAPSIWVI
jgi:hypothetical protein